MTADIRYTIVHDDGTRYVTLLQDYFGLDIDTSSALYNERALRMHAWICATFERNDPPGEYVTFDIMSPTEIELYYI